MSTTIDIKGTEYKVVLKDPGDLTNKEVKEIEHAGRVAARSLGRLQELGFDPQERKTWTVAAQLTDEEAATVDLYQRTCFIKRVESWTVPRPLPTTAEEVDDLPRSIFVPVTIAAAADAIYGEEEFDVNPDPKAPTENSDASS